MFSKNLYISQKTINEEIKIDNLEIKINIIKRTLENNTHEVIQDSKIKNVTSWKKSKSKFRYNLVFNILSFGILHLISLFYPNLYIKLYCKPCLPKECDFFLVESIYNEFTMCPKNYGKKKDYDDKKIIYNSCSRENMASSSLINTNNNKTEIYLAKHLTYSFEYKSVTYEYNEETNEIIPVYMNISKMTNRDIFNYFFEGLLSDNSIKKFQGRYGKNEYKINMTFFSKFDIISYFLVFLSKIIDLINKDSFSTYCFFINILIITIIIFAEHYFTRTIIYKSFKNEYTLDGENIKIKVKRRHMLSNQSLFYSEINNCDLLPGDIIYLKENDFVPCDCIILEGECVVNEINLTGNLDTFKKTNLKNNNEQFNYILNKPNTLYHGMKIIKTYTKRNEGYISALCINIGPNTFKANLFSNILFLHQRKKNFKTIREAAGEKKQIFMLMIFIFIFSLIILVIYPFLQKEEKYKQIIKNTKKLTILLIIMASKSLVPMYFLTNSILNIRSVIHLKNENIICFDKSKIINASRINTIFFSKNSLCDNFEINAFHPIYINIHKPTTFSLRSFKDYQYKEMNKQLLEYYNIYLSSDNITNNQNYTKRNVLRLNINQINKDRIYKESCKYTSLFLECLLSCNNIEKINTEILGNPLEKKMFLNFKWDMKPTSKEDNDSYNNYNKLIDSNNNKKDSYDPNCNIIDKRIIDICPNNYFKMAESINNKNEKKVKIKKNSELYSDYSEIDIKNSFSVSTNDNYVKTNISKNQSKTYKLRIYKRFINNGTLNSSSITYNFITKELRFMTKGISEEILDKCDINSFPENLEKIFSLYRRLGFTIIICATKIINIEDYNDSTPIEDYMNNLTFCGFVTLKNKLKNSVLNSIKDLKQFNCNLIITTGDNVYNALSVGFASSIIENKNVFSFDKDDINRIIITKIYRTKKINEINEDENDIKSKKSFLTKYSKHSSKGINRESHEYKDSIAFSKKRRRNKSFYRKSEFIPDSEKRQLNDEKKKNAKGSIKQVEKEDEKKEKIINRYSHFFSISSERHPNKKEIDMIANRNTMNQSIASDKIQKMQKPSKKKSVIDKEILSNLSNRNRGRKSTELKNIYYY